MVKTIEIQICYFYLQRLPQSSHSLHADYGPVPRRKGCTYRLLMGGFLFKFNYPLRIRGTRNRTYRKYQAT